MDREKKKKTRKEFESKQQGYISRGDRDAVGRVTVRKRERIMGEEKERGKKERRCRERQGTRESFTWITGTYLAGKNTTAKGKRGR